MLQPPIQIHRKTCINNDVHTIYLFIYVLFPNHIFSQIDRYIIGILSLIGQSRLYLLKICPKCFYEILNFYLLCSLSLLLCSNLHNIALEDDSTF